jgi:hypothetical protein
MYYKVAWEIDIEADSPEDAAREALAIMRNPHSIATVFEVWGNDQVTHVDLTEIDDRYAATTGPGTDFYGS